MADNGRTFKKIDLIIQLLLLVSIGGTWFFYKDLAMMGFFCGLGGWQLISVVFHLVKGWESTFLGRKIYLYVLLTLVTSFLLSLLYAPVMIWILYLSLFITPVMAFYYLVICYIEYTRKP